MAGTTGIRARHARSCRSRDGARCNCQPSYEAAVYAQRDGRKVRKSFPTLAAAKRWRADATRQVGRGELRAAPQVTLSRAAAAWLSGARDGAVRNRSGDVYKPSVVRGYEQALRDRVLPDLGALRLGDVHRRDVQTLVGRMQAAGLGPSTIRNALMPLRAIYRDRADDCPVNPTAGVRLPAVRGRRERIADPAEAAALLAALDGADGALFATAMYAGLRLGELRALLWADVDLAAGLIRVERSWDPQAGPVEPKSRAGRRRVPVAPVLRDALVEHRMGSAGDGLVFGRAPGRPFNASTVVARAHRAWEAAGLDPIGLHECRHTFASLMIHAGVNAKALSTYLGHASVTITFDRYGHLMPGSEGEAAGLLTAYLDRANTAARLAQLG